MEDRRIGHRFQTTKEEPHCPGDQPESTNSKLLQPVGDSLGNQESFFPLATQRPLPPGWNLAGSRGKASNSPGQLLPPGKQAGQEFLTAGPVLTCKAQRRAY